MSSGNTFNFGGVQQTASGDGAVNQVGNNIATTTVNKGDSLPTVPQVFGEIRKALNPQLTNDPAQDESPAEQPAVEANEQADDVDEQILRPLQTMAELPEAELKKAETIEQAQSLLNRLAPFAPQIAKGLAVFGQAALTALASSNPIISGILAVCKMGSAENPGNSPG